MTTSIYGSLERDLRHGDQDPHRGDLSQEDSFQIGSRGIEGVQNQRKYSLESFDFPDSSSISAPNTQPTSPVDGKFERERSFRPIQEEGATKNGLSLTQNAPYSNQQTGLQRQDVSIDFPSPKSLSRSTTSDSFDTFSLLDEVEFPVPTDDLPPPPPCPSGLYGSLLTTSQHHGGASNLVNAALGGMLRGGSVGGRLMIRI